MNATLTRRRPILSTPPVSEEEGDSLQEKPVAYHPKPVPDKETDDKKCGLRHACASAMDSTIALLKQINAQHEKPQSQ